MFYIKLRLINCHLRYHCLEYNKKIILKKKMERYHFFPSENFHKVEFTNIKI